MKSAAGMHPACTRALLHMGHRQALSSTHASEYLLYACWLAQPGRAEMELRQMQRR
jgi:hypothetical protein